MSYYVRRQEFRHWTKNGNGSDVCYCYTLSIENWRRRAEVENKTNCVNKCPRVLHFLVHLLVDCLDLNPGWMNE